MKLARRFGVLGFSNQSFHIPDKASIFQSKGTANMTNHENLSNRNRIHFISSLRLNLVPYDGKESIRLNIEDPLRDSQQLVQQLGFESDSLLLSDLPEATGEMDTTSTDSGFCSLPLGQAAAIPLSRLTSRRSRPADLDSMQPAETTFAGASDVAVIGPGISRSQQLALCQEARQSVVLIDGTSYEFACEGSWPSVFRAASAVVISEAVARKITVADTDSAAAKSLQNMSRGAVIIVSSPEKMTYCARNQIRTLPISAPSNDSSLATTGAIVAVGLARGCDAEQCVMAAVAAVEGERKESLDQLIARGRELVQSHVVRLAHVTQTQRRMRLVGAAAVGAVVGLVVASPWL